MDPNRQRPLGFTSGLETLSCLSSLEPMALGEMKPGIVWAWDPGKLVREVAWDMGDYWGLMGRQRMAEIGGFELYMKLAK
jgi:hypothetical protein